MATTYYEGGRSVDHDGETPPQAPRGAAVKMPAPDPTRAPARRPRQTPAVKAATRQAAKRTSKAKAGTRKK